MTQYIRAGEQEHHGLATGAGGDGAVTSQHSNTGPRGYNPFFFALCFFCFFRNKLIIAMEFDYHKYRDKDRDRSTRMNQKGGSSSLATTSTGNNTITPALRADQLLFLEKERLREREREREREKEERDKEEREKDDKSSRQRIIVESADQTSEQHHQTSRSQQSQRQQQVPLPAHNATQTQPSIHSDAQDAHPTRGTKVKKKASSSVKEARSKEKERADSWIDNKDGNHHAVGDEQQLISHLQTYNHNHQPPSPKPHQQTHSRVAGGEEEEDSHKDEIIKLNIGGFGYTTTRTTLLGKGRGGETFFTALLSGRFHAPRDQHGAYFIDRDGQYFAPILTYLRTGKIILLRVTHAPPHTHIYIYT